VSVAVPVVIAADIRTVLEDGPDVGRVEVDDAGPGDEFVERGDDRADTPPVVARRDDDRRVDGRAEASDFPCRRGVEFVRRRGRGDDGDSQPLALGQPFEPLGRGRGPVGEVGHDDSDSGLLAGLRRRRRQRSDTRHQTEAVAHGGQATVADDDRVVVTEKGDGVASYRHVVYAF